MRQRILIVATAVALTLSAAPSPAAAFHGPAHFSICASQASTDCIVSFAINTTNGLGGTSFPAGLEPNGFFLSGGLQLQVNKTGFGDLSEISSVVSTASEITITVRLAAPFTPSMFIGAGTIVDWRWNGGAHELTVIAFPTASSWAAPTCYPGNCPTNATTDYTAMALFFADDTVVDGAPPDAAAFMTTFLTKFTGGYISTNAQYFAAPFYDGTSLLFDLGAPHFKTNGSTVNTGFFRVLVPDPVISDLWLLDPSSFSPGNYTVTVGGTPTTTTLTRVTGRSPFPDGWLFASPTISFSTPRVAITPVAAASVPEPARESPATREPILSESGFGPSNTAAPVGLPPSGTIRSGLTMTGAGASVAFAPGTALTLPEGEAFSGTLLPPLTVPDPTGGKMVSVTHLRASGAPVGGTEIRLSRPATLTLPVPKGANAADFQPAQAIGGELRYLPGLYTKDAIVIQVDRIPGSIAPFGLVKVR
jgi:hypothetical protein